MSSQTISVPFERRHTTRRFIAFSAGVYLAAWVIGLFVSPAAPSTTASAEAIHRHFVANHGSALLQSYLVHGVAGIALAAFVITSWRTLQTSDGSRRRPILAAGIGAALLSLIQVAIAQGLFVHVAGGGEAVTTAALFDAINYVDSAKLLALSAFVTFVTVALIQMRVASRMTKILGRATAVLLPVGGATFIVPNPLLTAALYASLPALLVWVAHSAPKISRAADSR